VQPYNNSNSNLLLLKNKQTGKYCYPTNTNGYNNIACSSETKIPLEITQFYKSEIPSEISCNINNCNNALRNAYANGASAAPAYSNINQCQNCPKVPSGQLVPTPQPPAPPAPVPETPASYPIPYSEFSLQTSESGPYCYIASSSAIECDSKIPSRFDTSNQHVGSEISANGSFCYDNTFGITCGTTNQNFHFFMNKGSETNPNIVTMESPATNKYCSQVTTNGYNLLTCNSASAVPLYLSQYVKPATPPPVTCNKTTCNNALRNAYPNGLSAATIASTSYTNPNECLGCPSVPYWQLIP